MSLSIEIGGNAQLAEQRLLAELDPAKVAKLIARAAMGATRDHFRARNRAGSKRNASGQFTSAGRSNYWNDAAAATSFQSDAGTAKVLVDKEGVGLHYFGGTVEPVEATYLTIPARAEAKGQRAGEIDGLRFAPNKNGNARLIDEAGEVWFWLVKSVTLESDESVLPDENEYNNAITAALQNRLAALLDQRGAA